MWDIKEQILEAANSLNIGIKELKYMTLEVVVNQVTTKFAKGSKTLPLWEYFEESVSVNNPDAWLWLGELIGDNETIMFFNPFDEKDGFSFNNGEDIVAVLKETFGFEFYLTNKDIEFVICFNHHDVLIACGSAMMNLNNYMLSQN